MSVVWLILKVLLWILLIIVGLIVGLTILLLILPIEYWAEGEKYEEMTVHARLRIFYLLTVVFEFENGKETLEYRICGKRMGEEKKTSSKDKNKLKEKVKPIKKEKKVNDNKVLPVTKEHEEKKVQVEVQTKVQEHKIKKPDQVKEIPNQEKQKTPKFDKEVKNSIHKESKEHTTSYDKEDKSRFKDKLENIKDIYYQVKVLWDDPERRGLLRAIKKLGVRLMRVINPKLFRFKVIIGREDPADTGELLAKASFAYPWYGKYGIIQGNFEEAGLWGEMIVEGRLCLGQIIGPFIRFFLNHSVRHYIKIILDTRKEERNGI